jgi:exonuclease SbcD
MVKILHTGDIHIGAKLAKLGAKADEQRVQIQKTFEHIVDLAIERKIDLFIIAGDLFDSNAPEQSLIDFVVANIVKLHDHNIYVAVALGTHDYLADTSILKKLPVEDLPRVKIFVDRAENSWKIPELSTIVFCNASVSNKTSESPLKGISRNDEFINNIAIAHGSVQIPGKSSLTDSPITPEDIENTHMDYIALGHWHNQQDVSHGSTAWYCGAPEMIDLDQTGSGKVLIITIDDEKHIAMESVVVGKRTFDELKITIDGLANEEELISKIKEGMNVDLIREVILDGSTTESFGVLDEDEIYKRIGNDFFYLTIKNNSIAGVVNLENIDDGNIVKMEFIKQIKAMGGDEKLINDALTMGLSLIDGKTKVY